MYSITRFSHSESWRSSERCPSYTSSQLSNIWQFPGTSSHWFPRASSHWLFSTSSHRLPSTHSTRTFSFERTSNNSCTCWTQNQTSSAGASRRCPWSWQGEITTVMICSNELCLMFFFRFHHVLLASMSCSTRTIIMSFEFHSSVI
ncbi:hypothetical protein BDR05DRAFT_155701 [Suillus weaverae]|nr:hypothetical protein BDR05DRAFT_155701 [Suillus weaverae]